MRYYLLGSTIFTLATLASAQRADLLAPFQPAVTQSGAGDAPRLSELTGSGSGSGSAAALRQEKDYSPRALFYESHGAFLQKSRRYKPAIAFSYTSMPDASLKNEPGSFDLDRLRFDMTLPLAIDPDNMIYLGGRFGVQRYNFSPAVAGAEDDKLYEAGVQLGFGSFLSDATLLEVRFTPGIYSDWDGTLHGKDYKFYGNALLTGRVQENLFLKIGLAYNATFEQVPVYPRLGLAWAITSEFRFDMLLPEYIEFSWVPSSAFVLSLGTECYGEQYRTRTSLGTGHLERKQQTQELDAYLRGVIRFDDHFSFFGKVGTAYAGDNDFRDSTNAKFNGTMDWNLFFEVGFGIDF